MNATEQHALHDSLLLYDELTQPLDARTLEILDRRRKTATIRRRGWLTRRLLAVSDAAGLAVAMAVVQFLFGSGEGATDGLRQAAEIGVFVAILPIWLVAAKIYGLFDRDEERTDYTTVDDFVSVVHILTLGVWITFASASLTAVAHPDLAKMVTFWGISILSITSGRAATRAYCRRRLTFQQNALIVGAGFVGQLVAKKLVDHPEYGINLVGFLDAAPREIAEGVAHLRVLGPPDRLAAIVRLLDVDRVIIAFSSASHEEMLGVIRQLKDLDVQTDIVPRFFEITGPNVGIHLVGGLPVMGLPPLHLSASSLFVKRTIDVALSSVGLLVLSPLLAYIAARIRRDTAGPILYRHARVGPGGRPIRVFKFRTMYAEHCSGAEYGGNGAKQMLDTLLSDPVRRAEFAASQKLAGDPRVTPYGERLRRSSFDELPQLFNVLLGQLSLVGPRPVTADELARYGDDAAALLNLRPGITGYWQVNGRSNLSYEERVRLDMAYVFSWSLRLDLTILAKTARAVFTGQGAR